MNKNNNKPCLTEKSLLEGLMEMKTTHNLSKIDVGPPKTFLYDDEINTLYINPDNVIK